MRLPGRAWLQYEVEPSPSESGVLPAGPIVAGGSVIRQTAIFDPAGVLGLAYWYALWPVHQYVFSGLLRAIGRRVLQNADDLHAPGMPPVR
jgi:hypothetical protein